MERFLKFDIENENKLSVWEKNLNLENKPNIASKEKCVLGNTPQGDL